MSLDPRAWATTLSPDGRAAILALMERNPPSRSITALATCAKLLSNVSTDASKYGVLKSSSRALQERLLSLEDGEAAVISLGFEADVAAGAYVWPPAGTPAPDAALSAAAVRAAHGICEALHAAIVKIGDSNTPSRATDAVSLLCTYVGNILGASGDASGFRRIGAANRALCGRVLAVTGGPECLRASGFVPEPITAPVAFVCASDAPTLRLVLALLSQAGAVWQSLAESAAASEAGASASAPVRQASVEPGAMEGVWCATFTAVASTGHEGLHDRRGDKLLLPPSALEAIAKLTEEKYGTSRLPNPLCLRLGNYSTGRSRPAGVLQFTAPEGHVVCPCWMLSELGAEPGALLRVSSADCPRATMLQLRPQLTSFHLAEDPQMMLQLGLHGVYTTLVAGETIRIADLGGVGGGGDGGVGGGGGGGGGVDGDVELLVSALHSAEGPVDAVCIVDIEQLEVDLGESLEGEQQRQRAEEHAAAAEAAAEAAARAAEEERQREAAAAEATAAEHAARRRELRDGLPPEPDVACATAVAVVVRLPSERLSRRFERRAALRQVRAWIESCLPIELHSRRFELVSTHPRFVAGDDNDALTLEETGLADAAVVLNFHGLGE